MLLRIGLSALAAYAREVALPQALRRRPSPCTTYFQELEVFLFLFLVNH